jgi:hypothetical protein
MGVTFSTDEKIIQINDVKDEKIKEKTEKFIKENIKKEIGIPTFSVPGLYQEINPKNKKVRYYLDQITLVKIMKQLTTDDYIISYSDSMYWNISFIQRNAFLT